MSAIAPLLGILLGMGAFLAVGPRSIAPPASSALSRWASTRGLPAPGRLLTLCAACAAGAALVPVVAAQPTAITVVAAIAGALLPVTVLRVRIASRAAVSEGLWPDLVDHLVAALRSGSSLPDAFGLLWTHAHPVLRPVLYRCDADWRACGQFTVALDRLKRECADPHADRVAEILRMAYEIGGRETIPVLRDLSRNLRDDHALRSEINSRRSWVTNTARLGIAAPWIVLAMLASRPEASAAYASAPGAAVILAGAGACALAYWGVVRIGRSGAERRWLA